MTTPTRVVSWFSCGAASAAATHLALNSPLPHGATEVVVAYCDTAKREHPDIERATTFDGTWPAIDMLKNFKPWNKK